MTKKLSKEIKEWILLLSVIVILFTTGWYKDVASFLQRGLLETGILQPDIEEQGKPADYNFTLVSTEGEIIPFDTFRGQTVFMNFWATWCPPCIAEMPDIHDLYIKVGKDVKFVMISVDENPETARKFIERKGFQFPVYFLRSRLPNAYETSTIPTTYVLTPDGRIAVDQRGLSKYDSEKFRDFLLSLNKSQPTP